MEWAVEWKKKSEDVATEAKDEVKINKYNRELKKYSPHGDEDEAKKTLSLDLAT